MGNKNKGKRIGIAGNKNITTNLIEDLISGEYSINSLITMHPNHSQVPNISGYRDLRAIAQEKGMLIYHPHKYSLKSAQDEREIKGLGLDLLVVMGWQRLIPKWFLDSLTIGSVGMHGSSESLPKGRGRSPMNWSLIEGKQRFLTHLFYHDNGIDSGNIIGVQEFDINPFDTAETLHYKNQISATRLLLENLPGILSGKIKGRPQTGDPGKPYPKRAPEDGLINWNMPVMDVYNLVRAVTRPFPGAFSFLEDRKVMIWRAQPFDSKILYPNARPGEIVEVFYSGDFVVKTRDASLLVREYEGIDFKQISRDKYFKDQN